MATALLDALILAVSQGRVSHHTAAASRALTHAASGPGPERQAVQMATAPDAAETNARPAAELRLFDIGANLLDSMYEGVYHGKKAHDADLHHVLARAAAAGVEDVMITAGSLAESRNAVQLVRSLRGSTSIRLGCTVGVHPTRCNEFERPGEGGSGPTTVAQLLEVARDGMSDGTVVAIGEIGLDYDRLHFCAKDVQRRWFEAQLQLGRETGLPLFLHNRNTTGDFAATLRAAPRECYPRGGVVHSFDGDAAGLSELLALDGLCVGINGCSMRTEENLAVAASVPLDRLMIETDAPWCQIKRTHAGFVHVQTHYDEAKKEKWSAELCVKARNEPCHLRQVLEVLAGARGAPILEVAHAAYANSARMFRLQ